MNEFRIDTVGSVLVLRDDLYPGGTKARVLPRMLAVGTEYVYASPAYGYAQIALAHAARAVGALATVFVAKRATMHPRTEEARRAGAKVVQVPTGYLSNVQSKARGYCELTGATFMPFGFDSEDFLAALEGVVREAPAHPPEVWSVAGSGVLSRAMQRVWTDVPFHAVQIGQPPNVAAARLWLSPLPFERDATEPPPFPSCSNYDAKAWAFILRHAAPGALFWNVAA